MTFTKRALDVEFQLATGQFGEGLGDTVRLTGLRVSADIVSYIGVEYQGSLALRVQGLPLSVINQLTTIGTIQTEQRNNIVRVFASTETNAMSLVYSGQINSAFGDFNGAPDVVFNVTALAAQTAAMLPVPAVSFKGVTDVATILDAFCQVANLKFINYGVNVQLSDPYFAGSTLDKIKRCVAAAAINASIGLDTLTIWPKTGEVTSPFEIIVSPATGMNGYPAFSSKGLAVNMMFNPTISVGVPVTIQSSLPVANGKWQVYSLYHRLQSETPNGAWFTQIEVSNPYVKS
jgi:hypothetical protein